MNKIKVILKSLAMKICVLVKSIIKILFCFKTRIYIIVILFFFPFIGIGINSLTSWSIGDLYTLGLDRKDFFTVWIALFGAIGIAFNIYQNHRRTTNQDIQLVNQNIQLEKQDKQLEKQAEQIQLQGTQLELQSKSQRDSRFSKGVELLGNANESARTGAAYSLFFLAKDYPEEFAKPVFEILCSHVRSITTTEEYKKRNEERPSNEIQSILDLLFRNDESRHIFDGLNANLAYSNLIGANLSEAYLFRLTNLLEADLSGAKLLCANLPGATLIRTKFICANLSGSNLAISILSETNLSRADLSGVNLSLVDLSSATIDNTTFSKETNLDGVDMSQIDLTKIRGEINPKYLHNPENRTNADSQ